MLNSIILTQKTFLVKLCGMVTQRSKAHKGGALVANLEALLKVL
jgi:hypothetical protein